MRNYLKGLVLFVAVMAILYNGNKEMISDFIHAVPDYGTEGVSLQELFDRTYNEEELEYHDDLMDLNSLYMRYSGVDVVEKEDMTVVRQNSGQLSSPDAFIDDDTLNENAEKISVLSEYCRGKSIDFLYVAAPDKGYFTTSPGGYEDNQKDNSERFYADLQEKAVPSVFLGEEMAAEGIDEAGAYFNTDHHWTPETAFWAVGKTLAARELFYQKSYNRDYTDLANFNIQVYEDWFLGSQGKKTGAYFTKSGPDDISLITPKFPTSFTEEQPFKGEIKEGDFSETAIVMENFDEKKWYEYNPYAGYSGGDFRLQILTNHTSDNDQTVLLIRDSFGCAYAPFLSLNFARTIITDVRDGNWYIGDKQNVYRLIRKYQPDCVIVLYSGVPNKDDSRLDFDN